MQLLEDDEPADDLSVKANQHKVSLLYAWGKNKNGELSLGNPKSAFEPTTLRTSVGYARQIASGYKHSALVNSDGLLFVTGELLHGKLGLDKEVTNIFRFQVQPHLQAMKVKQVACGSYHTLALIENGDVYSWGGTLWGKTGQKSGRVSQVHILAPHRITEIACGDSHSIALSEKGDVFSWGGGGANKNKGQLGHSNYKDLENPEQIQFFKGKKLKTIACGDCHTMALTEENELFAWGEGMCGQLGTGGKDDLHTPKKINIKFNNDLLMDDFFSRDSGKEKPRVEKIALGGKHSLILTNKGHLYVCGFGSQGQLGVGKIENIVEPTLVTSLIGK